MSFGHYINPVPFSIKDITEQDKRLDFQLLNNPCQNVHYKNIVAFHEREVVIYGYIGIILKA